MTQRGVLTEIMSNDSLATLLRPGARSRCKGPAYCHFFFQVGGWYVNQISCPSGICPLWVGNGGLLNPEQNSDSLLMRRVSEIGIVLSDYGTLTLVFNNLMALFLQEIAGPPCNPPVLTSDYT